MMQIYRTKKDSEPAVTEIVDTAGEGSWIRLTSPDETELARVARVILPAAGFLKSRSR